MGHSHCPCDGVLGSDAGAHANRLTRMNSKPLQQCASYSSGKWSRKVSLDSNMQVLSVAGDTVQEYGG